MSCHLSSSLGQDLCTCTVCKLRIVIEHEVLLDRLTLVSKVLDQLLISIESLLHLVRKVIVLLGLSLVSISNILCVSSLHLLDISHLCSDGI
jgi:hypothetical protein